MAAIATVDARASDGAAQPVVSSVVDAVLKLFFFPPAPSVHLDREFGDWVLWFRSNWNWQLVSKTQAAGLEFRSMGIWTAILERCRWTKYLRDVQYGPYYFLTCEMLLRDHNKSIVAAFGGDEWA